MLTREQIEVQLQLNVDNARAYHKRVAVEDRSLALLAYVEAVRELSDFIIKGIVPERFR